MPAGPPQSSRGIALIWGDDEFAVKRRGRQLYQEWCQQWPGLDHETIDASAGNSSEALSALAKLRESLQTLPFFGSGKVVWFQDCNFFGEERTASSQAVTERVAEITAELKTLPWDNLRLLITSGKVDKRRTLYKTLEKIAQVEAFAAWSADDREWTAAAEQAARTQLDSLDKTISAEALGSLVAQVGPNSRALHSEVEKLAAYTGARAQIDAADIEAIVSKNKQSRAFALGEALGDRHLPRLLRALDEELWELKGSSQRSEIGILYGLISKVRALLLLKEMVRQGWVKSDAEYAKFKQQLERVPPAGLPKDRRFNPLAFHPFVLYKALSQIRNYTLPELVRAMDLLLRCNERLIFSSLEGALVLQQTLVKIAQKNA